MASSRVTLKDFFTVGGAGLALTPHPEFDVASSVVRLKANLSEMAHELRWATAKAEVLKQIDALLDVDLVAVMSRAWKKYTALLKYADPERYPPDRAYLVSLAEHELKSRHRPALDILFNGKEVGKIEFQVDLSLVLKGFILKIQGGRIMAIHTGECLGAGSILCENLVLLEKKSELFQLPGTIDMGEGIPFAPRG